MNKDTKTDEKAMAPRSTGLAPFEEMEPLVRGDEPGYVRPALAKPLRTAVSLFSRVPLALRGPDAL